VCENSSSDIQSGQWTRLTSYQIGTQSFIKNKEELDRWLSLLANVGVIAGIVFLAIEIRQNTEMVESQTRDSITEKQIASTCCALPKPPHAQKLEPISGPPPRALTGITAP